jgi:hypothetical protein
MICRSPQWDGTIGGFIPSAKLAILNSFPSERTLLRVEIVAYAIGGHYSLSFRGNQSLSQAPVSFETSAFLGKIQSSGDF